MITALSPPSRMSMMMIWTIAFHSRFISHCIIESGLLETLHGAGRQAL